MIEEDIHAKIIYNEISENFTKDILLLTSFLAKIQRNSVSVNLSTYILIGAESTSIQSI